MIAFALIALSTPPATASPATARAMSAQSIGDPPAITLAPDSEERWVPFDLTPGNQIRFTATVDGRALSAVLDTGVSYSVLARESPAVDVARLQRGGRAAAIGGAVSVMWLPTATLSFGGLTRRGGRLAVTPLPAVATGGAHAVDLLVGRDLLEGQALDIDYAERRFRLLPSGRLPYTGATAPLTVSAARHVYESAITIGGVRLAPMIVDTGDGSAITVTEAGWRAAGLSATPTTSALSYGIAGPVVLTLAVAPALSLGALTARNVELRVEPAGGFSQSIGVAGRIGSGFLQHYRVLLDPGAARMVLSAGALTDRPPLKSTSGLLVAVDGDRLRVVHVMRRSPAAAAGWREGETICRVNGQPIPPDYATSALAAWSIAPAGTVVTLDLCAGGERTLTTADFY